MGKLSKMPSANRKKKAKNRNQNEDEEAVEKEPQGSFAWKVLLPSQVRALNACESPEELQVKMASIMDLEQYEVDVKDACLLDYYVIAFHWAKEKAFDERQLSGFITLILNLLDNLKDHQMPKSANLNYLKECFSGVGFDNPDIVSVALYFFKLDDAKIIMQYLINTFFYHYSLYEYLFQQQQDEMIVGADELCIEVCPEMKGPFPPPLEEGLPSETYDEFVIEHNAKKEATPEEEPTDTEELTEAVLKAVTASDNEAVKMVSTSDLRKIIEKVTKDMIVPAKAEIQARIRDHEVANLSKISKLQVK